MMEDLKKRLAFGNSSVQSQAVQKLYSAIVNQKKTTESPINLDSQPPPELAVLWEKCGDQNESVAVACCEALVSLVHNTHADFYYIFKGLLNAVPTARSLVGIASALSDLLVIEFLSTHPDPDQPPRPQYGIRSRPHPFVTMATGRTDSWPILLHQVSRILTWPHKRVKQGSVSILEPFLRFILLEPSMSTQFIQLRLSLPRTLLRSSRDKMTRLRVITFLEDSISCLQIKQASHIGEAISLLELLSDAISPQTSASPDVDDFYSDVRGHVVCHCLALSAEASQSGLDNEGLVNLALTLTKRGIKRSSYPRLWLLTIRLLLSASEYHVPALLLIVRMCLKDGPVLPRYLTSMMYLPLLHLMSTPLGIREERHTIHTRAGHLVHLVKQSVLHADKDTPDHTQVPLIDFNITVEGSAVDAFYHLTRIWEGQGSSPIVPPHLLLNQWLTALQATILHMNEAPPLLTALLAGIACVSHHSEIIKKTVGVLEKVSTISPEQGTSLLPVFMFCLAECELPDLRLHFLNAIPLVAKHKVSIVPTLKTLQLLSGTASLKPIALKLTTSLWKQQDRCFPYLQKMLQASHNSGRNLDTNINEFLVTKALSIRDICKDRPNQHGADMLAPLSAILNECEREEDGVPAALALEGISLLCQAEVVDISTVWAVLSPKLSHDRRPAVVRRICELLSLIPSLAVNTTDYQEFRLESLKSLWALSLSENDVIASAAYRSLACFPRDDFTVEVLPERVTRDVREAIQAAEEDGQPIPETPGVCFTRLYRSVTSGVLPAMGDFLISLVNEEVTNLPRGIYHSAISRRSARPGQDKSLTTIPDLLMGRHVKNKQPALRSALASGMLFSFDPHLEAARDGKVRRPAYVSHGRTYHQMLYTLLNEIIVQPTDWHRCMALPQAWLAFMERCYLAYLEGRKAELSMAFDHGQVNDPQEHELHIDTAWLWCRDKLTDLIKSASRGGPSVQANCLLALASLAVATSKFASGIDDKVAAAAKEATEYLSHPHWLSIVTNTMMSILDSNYKPTGRIFTMCQQHPGQALSSASALARGGVCMALPLVVPILLTLNTDIIYQMMTSVVHQLPGQPRCDQESTALHFFYGLGLGMLLTRLFVEHFADVAGSQGESSVWEAVYALEKVGFSDHDNRFGSLLGLSVCLPAMCNDGRIETRVHITNLTDKLTQAMKTVDHKDIAYTGLSLCMATLAVSAYSSGLLGVEKVNQAVANVHDAHCNDINDGGLAVALAGMSHGLQMVGHPTINQLTSKLETTWMACIKQEDLSLLQKLCVTQGLLSLAGADANHFLLQIEESESNVTPVNTVVSLMTEQLQGGQDVAIQTVVSWRLGQLYMVAGNNSSSNASAPKSYQYLPDTSVLRPIIDCMVNAGKADDLSSGQLVALLRSLCYGPTRPLPPLNWTSILTPILRLVKGEEVTSLCLRLAIRQASSSPSASLLLTSWMLPPLWNGLKTESKLVILGSLDVIIKSVPAGKLREFFNQGMLNLFTPEEEDEDRERESTRLQKAALKGFCSALKVSDPPQSVTLAMYQMLEKLYQTLPQKPELYGLVSECLREVPDQLVDRITSEDFTDGTTFVKSSYVRCYLVCQGNQPLAWINPAIEMALWDNESALLYNSEPKAVLLELVAHCFYEYRRGSSEVTNPVKLSQWLLELMGHVKNVANGVTRPPDDMSLTPKTVEFGMLLFSALVVLSGTKVPYLLGVVPIGEYYLDTKHSDYLRSSLITLLPLSLSHLLQAEPWTRMSGKIIDWLISMYNCSNMQNLPEMRSAIKSCLRALRHTNEFKKIATWSQVYCLQA